MLAAKATYVVIGDKNGIRYTHPIADRIGKSMVGDDNDRALINGESYISIANGSMGQSIRGKAPILDSNGSIIGVVSIGYLTSELDRLYFYTLIIFLYDGYCTRHWYYRLYFLSRNIKKQILIWSQVKLPVY